jgi:hypothetical protein
VHARREHPLGETAEKLPRPTPPKTGSPVYTKLRFGLSGSSTGVVRPGVLPVFCTLTDHPSGMPMDWSPIRPSKS